MSISKGHGNLSLKPKNKAQKFLIMKNMGLRKQLLKNGEMQIEFIKDMQMSE